MKQRVWFTGIATLAVVAISACSGGPKPTATAEREAIKEPAKAPEIVSAKLAFYELYKPARAWATDLLALSVSSGEVPGFQNENGKAGMWTVVFVSPSRREARIFTYAIADSGTEIRKGVTVGNAQPWAGSTPTSKAFSDSEFMVDSTDAYQTASTIAARWLKAHPNQKATLRLGSASRYPAPIWYVMWGTNKNGYAALVNAVTGAAAK